MAQMVIRVSGQRQRHGALLADEIAKWLLQFSDNPLIPGSSLCTSRCPPPPEHSFVSLAAVAASSVDTAVAVFVVAAITVIVPPAIAAGCPVVPPPPLYTHLRARESFNDIINPTSSNKHLRGSTAIHLTSTWLRCLSVFQDCDKNLAAIKTTPIISLKPLQCPIRGTTSLDSRSRSNVSTCYSRPASFYIHHGARTTSPTPSSSIGRPRVERRREERRRRRRRRRRGRRRGRKIIPRVEGGTPG